MTNSSKSDQEPPAIQQSRSNNNTTQISQDTSPDCPFCTICTTFTPIAVHDTSNQEWTPDKLDPPSYVLLSTENVIAFLDIAPLTRGHVLVAPRKHRTKMGDLTGQEMAEIGRLLPLLARSIIRSVLPDIPHEEADYNIVQNNGPGAAQVIPHLHFHIVPRPPIGYRAPSPGHAAPPKSRLDHRPPFPPGSRANTKQKSKYPPSQLPIGVQQSYIQFGRGRRHELDDEDAAELVKLMREHAREEWEVEFGGGDRQAAESSDNGQGGVSMSGGTEKDTEGVIERFMGGVEDAAWIEGSGGLVRNLQRRGVGGRGSEKL